MNKRHVFGFFKKVGGIAQKILSLGPQRRPFHAVLGVLCQLEREFLEDLSHDGDLCLDLPMRDAFGIGMHLHHAGHELREVRYVQKKLAYLLGTRVDLNFVAVTRLNSKHTSISLGKSGKSGKSKSEFYALRCEHRAKIILPSSSSFA